MQSMLITINCKCHSWSPFHARLMLKYHDKQAGKYKLVVESVGFVDQLIFMDDWTLLKQTTLGNHGLLT